jgi:hypothetical protein
MVSGQIYKCEILNLQKQNYFIMVEKTFTNVKTDYKCKKFIYKCNWHCYSNLYILPILLSMTLTFKNKNVVNMRMCIVLSLPAVFKNTFLLIKTKVFCHK